MRQRGWLVTDEVIGSDAWESLDTQHQLDTLFDYLITREITTVISNDSAQPLVVDSVN